MITYTSIIGSASERGIAERLHVLEHRGKVDTVTLSGDDIRRRRLRVSSDAGVECGIALDRQAQLFDGAVLQLDGDTALVVRTARTQWLCMAARDAAAALELGYFAGNMHWAVRFEGTVLHIAVKGRIDDYRARLVPLLASGRIREVEAPDANGAHRAHHAAHDRHHDHVHAHD